MSPPSDVADREIPTRCIVLVGFMGSGKSTVGSSLAQRLGWRFVDADEEVEREAGATIEAIFRERGESAFREAEAEVTRRLLGEAGLVLATGGGWPAAEGRMEMIGHDCLSIWLRVSPEVAVARVSREGGSRPLLNVDRPARRAAELLREREAFYTKATLHLDTDVATPTKLVEVIVEELDREATLGRSPTLGRELD